MAPSLLIVAAQAADTIYVQPARDGLATAAQVAVLILAGAFVLAALGLAVVLFEMRGIHRRVNTLLGHFETKLDPVIDRARDIGANVEFISSVVRTDVQTLSDSVRSVSDRVQLASNRMEQRIEEFNALMEVVQSEAEDIFIGSAAAVRGVRAGARALRGGPSDDLLDEDDAKLLDEAGLAPRALEPAAVETSRAPEAAPGGVQVTGAPAVAGRRAGT